MGWQDTITENATPQGWQGTIKDQAPAPAEISATKAAGLGTIAGASFNLADEGYGVAKTTKDILTTTTSIKDALAQYRLNRDAARETFSTARQQHPIAYGTGEVAGAIGTSFVPGMGWVNAAKGASALKAIGAGVKAGALGGFGGSEADISRGDIAGAAMDTGQGALIGGGMTAGFQALPTVAKHTIPGSKDATLANKIASKVGSVFTDTAEEDINRWLSLGFKARNQVRAFKPEETAHALKPVMKDLEDTTNRAIQSSYKRYKDEFLAPAATPEELAQDTAAIKKTISDFLALDDMTQRRSTLYSGTTKNEAITNVRDLLERGNPSSSASKTTPINLDDAEWLLDDPNMVSLLKERLLDTKQYLSKSKVGERFENLPVKDKELFSDVYQSLNQNLKQAANGDKLQAADLLYSGDKTADNIGLYQIRERFFGDMKRGKEFDTSKMTNLLKTQTGRKLDFDDRLDEFVSYLSQWVEDPSWKAKVDTLQNFRNTAELRALATKMKFDTGGPSSQAILNVGHAGAAMGTGGLSLLAYPFTNPVGYTRMVDRLGAEKSSVIAKAMSNAAQMGARTLTLTDLYLRKTYPDYDALMKEEQDKKPTKLQEIKRGL